ncbi:MAG: hypothetical protein ACI399_07500 [Candidatus Cryptobacteroides sp.]
MMKNIKALALALACALLAFTSCNDANENKAYVALVTYEAKGNDVRLQLNDSTVLVPTNLVPEKDTVTRAMVNFTFEDGQGENSTARVRNVQVNSLEGVLTKKPAEDLGIDNGMTYGDDPIDVVENWLTIGEDGYLNLRFVIKRCDPAVAHYINLVAISTGSGEYVFELRHDARGDITGNYYDGVVAFDLNQYRPDDGSSIRVKIRWKSENGDKEDYMNVSFRKQ